VENIQQENTISINAEKARQKAASLYPNEKWEFLEQGIYIPKSRMPRSAEQINTLEKELRQARILVNRGNTVYLLPENPNPAIKKVKYPDAVVDGCIMEFKTIIGSIRQVEARYKEARAKANLIFILIDTDITKHDFARKLSGYIKMKGYTDGVIFAYFAQTDEFHKWTEKELASHTWEQKKSGSCDPAAIQGILENQNAPDD
jgi:hypothetical protein